MVASMVAVSPPDLTVPTLVFSPALWGVIILVVSTWIARAILKVYCDRLT